MQLVSNAQTLESLRDEIANYLAAQADNFAARKHATPSKTQCAQLEAIREALMQIAVTVKAMRLEPAHIGLEAAVVSVNGYAPNVSGFDYRNQAWVKDGVYLPCGHQDRPKCGCYGTTHEGQPVAPDAEVR